LFDRRAVACAFSEINFALGAGQKMLGLDRAMGLRKFILNLLKAPPKYTFLAIRNREVYGKDGAAQMKLTILFVVVGGTILFWWLRSVKLKRGV
jgi:hypothetical protein